jgi:P-type Cu+ transporter
MTETTIDLPVLGMTCAACVRRVEKAALAVPGVASADVNLPLSRARITVDPESRDVLVGAAAAIRAAGYEVPADVVDGGSTGGTRLAAIESAHANETAGLRRSAIAAIAATVPLLAIAMTHVTSEPLVIVQLVLGTFVVLGPGSRYLRAGVRAAAHRSPDMNTLIALGAGAAWLSSMVIAIEWLRGAQVHAPALYFEAGAAIVAFVMIGKLLEARARSKLADAVRGLMTLAPPKAMRVGVGDAGDSEIDAAELVPGDVIRVRPGDRVAADGTVIEGRSAVDESLLTGEALPVDKDAGTPVYAGTLNSYGALVVRVARAGADTALARIAKAVEDAQGTKAPIARLADRVSAVFVPIVLLIAAGTLGGWLIAGADAATAIEHAVAVLVIACPCALGLATPAAVAVGTARGAELGVLFRDGAALEATSRVTIACLDKTGTLTAGTPVIVGDPDRELLRIAASVEQASEHPIARAIVAGARERELALAQPTNAVVEPGAGIAASVGDKRVLVGTRDFLARSGVTAPQDDQAAMSISHVAIDGSYAGAIAVADPPASGARRAIDQLRALGVQPVMVSGDREAAVLRVAQQVGITEVHANTRPVEKAAIVRRLRERASVAMVGDGINDAPALAAADVGIAIGSGTQIAVATADVTLIHGGITTLPVAFTLARATLRVIRRNLAAASIYNLVCIPIAASGLLSPVLASAAMSLSSVSVLISSLALRRSRA